MLQRKDEMSRRSTNNLLQSFVSPKKASEILGVTTQTLRNWAKAGKISFVRLPSGHRHYNVEALVAVMAPSEPDPIQPLQRSPAMPVMPEPEIAPQANPMLAALAVLLKDPRLEGQIRAMLGTAAPAGAPAVTHATMLPMSSPDALKSAIEAIAAQV